MKEKAARSLLPAVRIKKPLANIWSRYLVLTLLCLCCGISAVQAQQLMAIYGILKESTQGMMLLTDTSCYAVKGLDASGLDGCKAIVFGTQGTKNGTSTILAREIVIEDHEGHADEAYPDLRHHAARRHPVRRN